MSFGKCVDRYLIRRYFTYALFSLLIFSIAWLAPERLFDVVRYVSTNLMTPQQGLAYLLFQIPDVLNYCIPISALCASVFLFRQLSLSSELIVMIASGISYFRLCIPMMLAGSLLSGLLWFNQDVLYPEAAKALSALNQVTHYSDKREESPQVSFAEYDAQSRLSLFMVINPEAKADQNQFVILTFQTAPSGSSSILEKIITAQSGVWQASEKTWHFHEAVRYTVTQEGLYKSIEKLPSLLMPTSTVPHELLTFKKGNPNAFSMGTLSQYVSLLERGRQTENARFYKVRWYQRLTLLLIPILFSFYGALIGQERSRAKRNMGLTYASVLLLVFNILVPTTTTLGNIGILLPSVAAMLPVMLIVLLANLLVKLRRLES
jgi:lipopolysaccharide export system permease protein